MIAFVLGVIRRSTSSGSRWNDSSSTSAKTTVAPVCSTTLAVAAKVIEGTITSSPGPIPLARRDRCIAAVQEFVARA